MHPIFHISLLKKFVGDPAYIVHLESVVVNDSLTYEDVRVETIDRQVQRLRNKKFALFKVLWNSKCIEGATFGAEESMIGNYPHLF